jgi:hypothetical protein
MAGETPPAQHFKNMTDKYQAKPKADQQPRFGHHGRHYNLKVVNS